MKNKFYVLLLVSGIGLMSCVEGRLQGEYIDSVNVFIGTGGHEHIFPGATLPRGMARLGPDTRLISWDACSDYYHDDTSIIEFNHAHLSGTGVGDYDDILFIPIVGEKPLVAETAKKPDEGYRSRFSHDKESVRPGYYQVLLQDDSINVELTVTLHAGLHRYTCPKGSDARLIINMEPTVHEHQHPITQIKVVNDSTIAGEKYTRGWAKQHYIYFYAVFSKSLDYKLCSGTEYQPDSTFVTVNTAEAVITFRNLPVDRLVLAEVGISSVDEKGAKLNLESGIPGRNFEEVVQQADVFWNNTLGKIGIKTSDSGSRTVFYTSLYHTFIQPSLASDIDGRYRTMEHEIKRDTSCTNHTVFPLWGTFRATHPLYTIITPKQNQAFICSLLCRYDELGILSKWELASSETGAIIGYHAVSVVADAIMKKQCDFDIKKAIEAHIRSLVYDTANITPMMNRQILNEKIMSISIKYKNEFGYIPCDRAYGAVSQGLEFAYNDWLIVQIMEEDNQEGMYDKYMKLSRAHREYFDPGTELICDRLSDDSWITPFDPSSVQRPSNYMEGNAWRQAWFVPQGIDGLMELVGGKSEFEAYLDTLFTRSSELTGDSDATTDVTGIIGQYAHGNKPSHHISYLYNYTDTPHKTQTLVDYILCALYHNDLNGLPGNEDIGQISAWYVLSSMGFYSFCPGRPVYEVDRPLSGKVTIHLGGGKDFVIRAEDNSTENKYVRSIKLNEGELEEPRFSHFDLMKRGELVLEMEK